MHFSGCFWKETTVSSTKHPTILLTEITGHEISHDRKKILNVQDAYTCQDICKDNRECTFFLYNPSNQKCFLKGTPFSEDDLITDQADNNHRVVGKKWCHAATTQVPGLTKCLIVIHSNLP